MSRKNFKNTAGRKHLGRRYQFKSMATKSYVKKQIAKETDIKFVDTQITSGALGQSTIPVIVSSSAEGSGENDREGLEVQLKSIDMRLQIQPNGTTATSAFVRVVLFRWFDSVAPVATDILLSAGFAAAPISHSSLTLAKKKYRIISTDTATVNITGQSHVMVKVFRKLNGKALFDGPLVGDRLKGNVFFVIVSNLAANGPAFTANLRCRFSK